MDRENDASPDLVASAQFMDQIDRGGHMLHGSIGKDPMPEIENVSGSPSGPAKNIRHAALDFVHRTKQGDRIEVPLYGAVVSHHGPGLIDRDTPIDADHVTRMAVVPVPKWISGTPSCLRPSKINCTCGMTYSA